MTASSAPAPEQWLDTVRQTVGPRVADWLPCHKEFATERDRYDALMAFASQWAESYGHKALDTEGFVKALSVRFFPPRLRVVR